MLKRISSLVKPFSRFAIVISLTIFCPPASASDDMASESNRPSWRFVTSSDSSAVQWIDTPDATAPVALRVESEKGSVASAESPGLSRDLSSVDWNLSFEIFVPSDGNFHFFRVVTGKGNNGPLISLRNNNSSLDVDASLPADRLHEDVAELERDEWTPIEIKMKTSGYYRLFVAGKQVGIFGQFNDGSYNRFYFGADSPKLGKARYRNFRLETNN